MESKNAGFSEPKMPYILCAKTREYRNMVSKVCKPNDVVLEVGSAHGVTSSMISKFCEKVVGIDKGEKEVSMAKERYPNIEFYIMDGNNIQGISGLGRFSLIFVDISGVVSLTTLLSMLQKLELSIKPRLFVVKSLELAKLYCKLKNGENIIPLAFNSTFLDPLADSCQSKSVTSAQLKHLRTRVLQHAKGKNIRMKLIQAFPKPFQTGKVPKRFEERARHCNIPVQRMLKCVFVCLEHSVTMCGKEIILYILPNSQHIDLQLIANAVNVKSSQLSSEFLDQLHIASSQDLKQVGVLKNFRNAIMTYGVLPPFGIELPASASESSENNENNRVADDHKAGEVQGISMSKPFEKTKPLRTFLHPELFLLPWHQELIFEIDFGEYVELSASTLQEATSGILLQYPPGSSQTSFSNGFSSSSSLNECSNLFNKTWPPPKVYTFSHHSGPRRFSCSPLAYKSMEDSCDESEFITPEIIFESREKETATYTIHKREFPSFPSEPVIGKQQSNVSRINFEAEAEKQQESVIQKEQANVSGINVEAEAEKQQEGGSINGFEDRPSSVQVFKSDAGNKAAGMGAVVSPPFSNRRVVLMVAAFGCCVGLYAFMKSKSSASSNTI